jgi:S-adenosylmethionine:tRNA ribosyltransferase-isomerase
MILALYLQKITYKPNYTVCIDKIKMKISDYNYELPDELIAQHPPEERGASRLLILNRQNGVISHRNYSNLCEFIEAGDVVVLNNTKVIKARLVTLNSNKQQRELLLLEEHASSDSYRRRAMYRGKLHQGETLKIGRVEITIDEVQDGGIATISSTSNLLELASNKGAVPLPPYMRSNQI